MRDFRSDNTLACSAEILEAINRAAAGTDTSYGGDAVTARLRRQCSEIFGREVEVFPIITGSAGNALGLSALTPAWGGVFCHEDAHIHRDELGATELYSGGAKLITIAGGDGKLHPDALARSIEEVRDSRRTAVPACISLTNATEAGTVYTNEETRALVDVARHYGLAVHLDGARFANAVVSKGATADGVDIMTLGATKNGGLTADAVLVFRKDLVENVALRYHRSGHRASKMRFLSAQLEAYLTNDLWLRNARNANAMAARLAERIASRVEIVRPVDANMLFIRLARGLVERLEREGFTFFDWPIFGPDVYRFVMGFSTTPADVDALAERL